MVTARPSAGSSHERIQCALGRPTIARLMYRPNGATRYSVTARTKPLLSTLTRAGTSKVTIFGGCIVLHPGRGSPKLAGRARPPGVVAYAPESRGRASDVHGKADVHDDAHRDEIPLAHS